MLTELFADTYQEANGLLDADRNPKFPVDEIAAATRGRETAALTTVAGVPYFGTAWDTPACPESTRTSGRAISGYAAALRTS